MSTTSTQPIAAPDTRDIICPFVILRDSREQHPFDFQGLYADAVQHHRLLTVPVEWRCLGNNMGDYAIDGLVGRCHVERKSVEDCQSTVLGWGPRRENFERELANLNAMQFGAVVVEGTLGACLSSMPAYGKKSVSENRKAFFRSVLAWQQRFSGVHWVFCDDRRLAEVVTFRMLDRFYQESLKG